MATPPRVSIRAEWTVTEAAAKPTVIISSRPCRSSPRTSQSVCHGEPSSSNSISRSAAGSVIGRRRSVGDRVLEAGGGRQRLARRARRRRGTTPRPRRRTRSRRWPRPRRDRAPPHAGDRGKQTGTVARGDLDAQVPRSEGNGDGAETALAGQRVEQGGVACEVGGGHGEHVRAVPAGCGRSCPAHRRRVATPPRAAARPRSPSGRPRARDARARRAPRYETSSRSRSHGSSSPSANERT